MAQAGTAELKSFGDSLFACTNDMGTCLIVCCLGPSITYGQNVDKLKGNGFMGPCLLYFCCPCFACIFAGQTRKEIREKYGLKEEPCHDMLVHCFCSPCAVCQEARELTKH
mmetsp:Transcript_11600/g.28434  ORF Transcript_11600/g.28434 Transcript_11600/m.28434 type:complete len:111 (-) Transcript_11600:207-539(-)